MEESTQAGTSDVAVAEAPPAGTATEATAAETSTEAIGESTPPDGTASTEATASAEAPATETPEDRKSRRERQREARKQPADPPEPPSLSVDDAVAAALRKRDNDAAVAQAQREKGQKHARLLGYGLADPNNPQAGTVYDQLQREATAFIPDLPEYGVITPEQHAEHAAAISKRNQALAKFNDLAERRELASEIENPLRLASRGEALDWVGNQLEVGIAEVGLDVQAVLKAGNSVADPGARLPSMVKAIVDQVKGPLLAEIADLKEDLKDQEQDFDTRLRRAGGQDTSLARGGVLAAGSGSVVQRLIQQAGSVEAYTERAMRGEYAGIDLTK